MKIALIGQKGIPAHYGGVERHVHELATRMVRDGFKVDAYTRSWYTGVETKEYQGVKLVNVPSIRTKHLDTITHTFNATIHALFQKNDIIHYHGTGPALLAWIPRLFTRAKIVVTFHSINRLHKKWGWFARQMLRLGEYSAHLFAHEIIAVSNTMAYYCSREYNRSVQYIPNGTLEPIAREADLIERHFHLKKDEYFLLVSRLVRDKGVHFLIDAYKRLNTDKKLVIVGGSSEFKDTYVDELYDLAGNDPNIIFTGFQKGEMLEELYANAYAFVLPSMFEGLPICVLEAMTYGRCVIASDIPENAELVKDYGFLFNSQNSKHLAEQMQYCDENPKEVAKLGEKAQKYVLNTFNWDTVVSQTGNLYKRVKYKQYLSSSKAIRTKKRTII